LDATKTRRKIMEEVDPLEEDFMSETLRRMTNTNKLSGIPKEDDIRALFCSEEATIKWLESEGILHVPTKCKRCGGNVTRYNKQTMVKCQNYGSCDPYQPTWCQSIFKGSYFAGVRGPKREVMLFLYQWLCRDTATQIGIKTGWGKQKVAQWTRNVEELVSTLVLGTEQQIGGDGIVVEIDESKFGKRKYHRGHTVEGSWVFGGVERTQERRVFLVEVADRTRETLFPLIKRFIAPGSIIISDCWAPYETIPDITMDAGHGFQMPLYQHEAVNHDRGFVGSDGRHTNTIEGTWFGVKRGTPVRKRNKKQISGCLFEFIWRRDNEGNLWNALVRALVEIRYLLSDETDPN
jgi:ISXO2-like transposase domain